MPESILRLPTNVPVYAGPGQAVVPDHRLELLRLHLSTTVPFLIMEWERIGGPSPSNLDAARNSPFVMEGADSAMFNSDAREGKGYWTWFTECVALLAFAPGGVRLAGLHFEAAAPPLVDELLDRVEAGEGATAVLDALGLSGAARHRLYLRAAGLPITDDDATASETQTRQAAR